MKSPNPVSDSEEIRLYLLGSLSQIRREQLEARLFSEPSLHDDLVAAEDDLVDEYLADKLTQQEHHQFVTHFTVTPERQRKVIFAKTFQRYLGSTQSDVVPKVPEKDVELLVAKQGTQGLFSRNSVLASALLVVCLGAVGIGWLNYNKKSAADSQRPKISVMLRPGTTRAAGGTIQKIAKPAADATVDFKLELGKSEYRRYRAELLRESESLASFDNLTAKPVDRHFAVEVVVDASLLENEDGDYRFKLSGVSESGEILAAEEYGFRISK
jgi:hypothetical protein